ncbi:uroporphyrinogen-III synthase [Ensifer adhaerens]|uniref:uroporphyrinogen-III synthase n=1 Tax=Ensifer adhaerens TaxID=106592 RepID=UPI000CF04683|nr:uroporphyrinogen-III synthase [Ensifer adhaerens]
MRVLVTRPLPAAEATARRLAAAGHRPILLPLMRAEHLATAAIAALETPHAAIVLTSAEAVRVLTSSGADLARHLTTPCFCVGDATAQAAAASGFTDLRIAAGTGESLAELIGATLDTPPPLPLLYLAGTPRSEGLEKGLSQRGIEHRTVECYRMESIVHPRAAVEDLRGTGHPDAVLLYSRETARQLVRILAEAGIDPASFAARYLCLSPAVAEALPDGVAAETAARPDEDSLISLL